MYDKSCFLIILEFKIYKYIRGRQRKLEEKNLQYLNSINDTYIFDFALLQAK